MDKEKKNTITSVIIVSVITMGVIVAFSIPLGIFPPLGEFLFPGDGLWNIDEEIAQEETISAPNLSNDVIVYRDQLGIPHIYGYSEEDLVFALGYVHAQDRLLQMDLARRATRGGLSEILGPDFIEEDKFSLTKLMDYWTLETVKYYQNSINPTDQLVIQMLISYSEGVNHYIENIVYLPLEFQFLNYRPDPWTVSDTFAFIKYMSEMLTWEYSDFVTVMIKDAIGIEGFNELFGYPLPYQIPICPDYGEEFNISIESGKTLLDQNFAESYTKISQSVIDKINSLPFEKEFLEKTDFIGSNNWAIHGNLTESGKPILCNDMHLTFDLPGIWYEAHLVDQSPSSDFNVYGFFIAGVPFPLVGHNAYVGWGITNTAYDVIDWYFYDSYNETHYMYKGEPTAYTLIEYELNVKGQDPEIIFIKNTIHGPVFDGLIDAKDLLEYADKVIACKWIAQNVTHEARSIYRFSHAKNRADFDEASRFFTTPASNLIYADVHGDIGIRPTGKVPIRNDTGIPAWHLGNGTMLYNGSAGHGEWIDYVPFDDLPHSENPDRGYLFSANQAVAGMDFLKDYHLQNPIDVSRGYRARRINTLLSTGSDFTIDDMKKFQLDFYSTKAGNFTSYLLDVIDAIPQKTSLQQSVYKILNDWDLIMDKNSPAPSIFNVWIQAFHNETFRDEVLDQGSPKAPSHAVLEWFTKNNASSKWFDNIHTPEVETRDDIILLAFEKSLVALENFYETSDTSQWIWGELHYLKINHITGLDPLGFGPEPINGTSDTISPVSVYNLWDGEENLKPSNGRSGASERMILDFSDLNNSLSIIPSGQRGISSSKHYTDQLMLFLNGQYHEQYFSADMHEKFPIEMIESKMLFKSGAG